MTRSKRLSRDLTALVAITIAVLLPLLVYLLLNSKKTDHSTTNANAKTAFIQSCVGNNQTRQQTLAFIDSTVARSELSLNATLHSASSSAEQKRTAIRNLIGLKIVAADAHRKLPQKSCAYPVELTTTTTRPKGH